MSVMQLLTWEPPVQTTASFQRQETSLIPISFNSYDLKCEAANRLSGDGLERLEGLGEGTGNDPNPLGSVIPTSSCGYALQHLGVPSKDLLIWTCLFRRCDRDRGSSG